MKLEQCQNIFYVIVNANSVVQHIIQIKNAMAKHVNVNVKIIVHEKKIIAGILAHENGKYLKSIVDTSVTECDEIITVNQQNRQIL